MVRYDCTAWNTNIWADAQLINFTNFFTVLLVRGRFGVDINIVSVSVEINVSSSKCFRYYSRPLSLEVIFEITRVWIYVAIIGFGLCQ